MTEIGDHLDARKLHFIEAAGVRMRYYEDGTGDPLVLLSGGEFGALYSIDTWSLNLDEFAKHFHVFAFDKPGQGYSDSPQLDSDFTFEWLLNSTCGAMRALNIRDAHVLGHSRGALLAARIAFDHPDLVKSVIMVDTSTTAPEDPHLPTDLFYDELAARMPRSEPSRESVKMEVDAQSYSKAHISDDFVDRLLQIASLPSVRETQRRLVTARPQVWYPSLYRERARTLTEIDERGLPVPTLLIWAFNDRAAPLYLGHRLFERLSPRTRDAEFHVLNHTGHYCFREQSHKFNRLIRSFCLE